MWIINKQGGYEDIYHPAETCVILSLYYLVEHFQIDLTKSVVRLL